MSSPHYEWRSLTSEEREELLRRRIRRGLPWHSPPHRPNFDDRHFHVAASCFEHRPHIGRTPERMDAFSRELLTVLAADGGHTFAWCVLPNHYHALVRSCDVLRLLRALGRLHGRTSHAWNGEEAARGRQVFFRAVERSMRSDAHFFATLNYVHHNPVRHGYAGRWTEWPWSSAAAYLRTTGEAEAARRWRRYPVRDYGKGWDDPAM